MTNYLYHYTSVETLALILKHKTLRFSNLSIVDDMEEQATKDFGDFGRFCFVSCWTKDREESIPLWHMYTPQMSGVRIRLQEHPFETEILTANDEGVKENLTYTKGLLLTQKKYDVIVIPYKAELVSVTYTEDPSLLNPKIMTGLGQNISIRTENIGKFKRSSWDFQKEYRYRIRILPFNVNTLNDMLKSGVNQIVDRLQNHVLPITHIDLHLSDESFKDMEILCGPKITDAQKIIVENLTEKFNPTAIIHNSRLRIK